jgi:hypothetical protein
MFNLIDHAIKGEKIMPILLDVAKYILSTVGIGVLTERFFKKTPHPPGLIGSIVNNPATPFVSGLLFQRPELFIRPLSRTTGGLGSLATKTASVLWSEKEPDSQKGSLNQAANVFFLLLDKGVNLAIEKPKVMGFIVISTCSVFILLEPVVHDYLETRRLKKLERRIKRRYQEQALIKSISESLNKDETAMVSNLISSLQETRPDSDGPLSDLAKQDLVSQRTVILKALKGFRK